jgi:hypothetical protein
MKKSRYKAYIVLLEQHLKIANAALIYAEDINKELSERITRLTTYNGTEYDTPNDQYEIMKASQEWKKRRYKEYYDRHRNYIK